MHVMRVGKSNFLKGWLSATVLACSVALAGQPSAVPPAELVRRAVQNEIGENGGSNPRFMFKDERKAAHLWQTKLLVETSEATAGMLIAQDGHSLTPQQILAEYDRHAAQRGRQPLHHKCHRHDGATGLESRCRQRGRAELPALYL